MPGAGLPLLFALFFSGGPLSFEAHVGVVAHGASVLSGAL